MNYSFLLQQRIPIIFMLAQHPYTNNNRNYIFQWKIIKILSKNVYMCTIVIRSPTRINDEAFYWQLYEPSCNTNPRIWMPQYRGSTMGGHAGRITLRTPREKINITRHQVGLNKITWNPCEKVPRDSLFIFLFLVIVNIR